MLVDLKVRQRTPTGYETVNDPRLTALLNMWRGDTIDQKVLFSRLVRTMDAVAEAYLVIHNVTTPGRLYWQLAQTPAVTDNRDGTATLRGRPGARPGDRWHHVIPDKFVHHVMVSDTEWDGLPWSQLCRAIGSIERYRAVMRTISRNLDSQLAMNGILWAKAVGEATNWPDEVKAWGHRAITSDDGPESVVPFMMSTAEKPEWLDVGRADHEDQIEVANLFLKAFAQDVDLPTQMLLEGPGQGNHWSAYLESDYYADYVMAPRLARATNLITETHLRPLLRALPSTAADLRIDDLEVFADDTRIRTRTDNADRVIRAREMGIATREAVAEVVGLEPDQVMPLPAGVDDFEAWMASQSRTSQAADQGRSPGTVNEPDRTALETDRARRVDRGPTIPGDRTGPTGEVLEATVEIRGELSSSPRPAYWNELVPTHR